MPQPHLIVLMADQLRRDVLGCYGGTHGCSPNVDRLAQESVAFDAHTCNSPLCVPSRSSMMTGLHPHVNGAIVNAWDKEEEPYGACRGHVTLAEKLAGAGYLVEHLGTDHLRFDPPLSTRHANIQFSAPVAEHRQHLKERGIRFDDSVCRSPCLDFAGGKPVTWMYTNPNTTPWPGPVQDFFDVWLTDRIDAVIRHADRGQPMCLWGDFWLPHCPLSCPEPYFSMFDPNKITLPPGIGQWHAGQSPMHLINLPGHVAAAITPEGWRKAWAVYLGMVTLLDECVGRLMNALREHGMWDDAVVVFTSDHGEMLGSHRMFQKMCMYEESLRVPLLIKPPAGSSGQRRKQLTQHLDLAATLLDYAGVGEKLGDGWSFRRVVESESATGRPEVFAEFNGNSGRGFQQRAIVTPTHKYIHNHGYEPEVYDLVADPRETNNLWGKKESAHLIEPLRSRLSAWMQETRDVIPPA